MRGAYQKYNNGTSDYEKPISVTQTTSNTTTVTLDAAQGVITMHTWIWIESKNKFTVNNNRVKAASIIIASVGAETLEGVGSGYPSIVGITNVADGSFDMIVHNPDIAPTLAAPIVHFHVLNPTLP